MGSSEGRRVGVDAEQPATWLGCAKQGQSVTAAAERAIDKAGARARRQRSAHLVGEHRAMLKAALDALHLTVGFIVLHTLNCAGYSVKG